MNEKLQYAEMLEIPVNTCNITYKPPKKRRGKIKKKDDEVKSELIDKVNATEMQIDPDSAEETMQDSVENIDNAESQTLVPVSEVTEEENNSLTVNIHKAEKKKRKFKFGVIGAQLTIIGALVATIFLTNALYADSGINTFFKGVFASKPVETVDAREYAEFAPVINAGETLTLENGVIATEHTGSLYSPCDGKITEISVGEDGKYSVEISHSDNFKTVVSGLQFVYGEKGSDVFTNVPVGYVAEVGATFSFYGSSGAITNFTLNENTVVWAV